MYERVAKKQACVCIALEKEREGTPSALDHGKSSMMYEMKSFGAVYMRQAGRWSTNEGYHIVNCVL